jgi:phospholipid:diacylglycerol acyltransferase
LIDTLTMAKKGPKKSRKRGRNMGVLGPSDSDHGGPPTSSTRTSAGQPSVEVVADLSSILGAQSSPPALGGAAAARVRSSSSTEDSLSAESSSPETNTDCSGLRSSQKQAAPKPPCFSTPCKFILFLVFLWASEVATMILLKRYGVVEPNFRLEEAVLSSLDLDPSWLREQQELLLNKLNESLLSAAPLMMGSYLLQENLRPGYRLASEANAKARYPVVMVPGFVTSGLEVWAGQDCGKRYFRQRLWADAAGARSFILDTDCWKEHMSLDPVTGGDPEGIRLRSSSGFEAADYFIANYWVWSKLIENLADVGYTPSTMAMMPYDWRLAFPLLEERDGYLTRLKSQIQDMHKVSGHKVVLTSHSMGALVVHYFFAWVTTGADKGGGGGGKDWLDRHIHSYVNIAGSHLGVPKAASALLSGEMSDTVIMGPMGTMVEQFFGRRLRRDLWSTWGSLWSMLPKGGDALWSPGADLCLTMAPDDPFCHPEHPSPLLFMTSNQDKPDEAKRTCPANETLYEFVAKPQLSTEDTINFLQAFHSESNANHSVRRHFSFHGDEPPSLRTWHDPTRTPLPHAPNMRIYCLYGTGIDTERAYFYRATLGDPASSSPTTSGGNSTAGTGESVSGTNHSPGASPTLLADPVMILDSAVDNESQKIRRGVRYTDGDGSVPLLSLGYLCIDAWRRESSGLNPSKIPVTSREYKNQREFVVDDPMRGGPRSSEHVDMLGNLDMMEDFLRIVTGYDDESVQEDRIASDIREIANRVNSYHGGGIFKKRKNPLWPF